MNSNVPVAVITESGTNGENMLVIRAPTVTRIFSPQIHMSVKWVMNTKEVKKPSVTATWL